LAAFEPHLEASLGTGRVLKLSQRRLELEEPGRPARTLELKSLASASLIRRPIWEALLFAPLGAAMIVMPWGGLRAFGVGFVALSFAAAFLQRRFTIHFSRAGQGASERWSLGFGRPGSAIYARLESVWSSLSQELIRLGIPVREPE
jgi:hypothetical protein